jgi:hypothetical protein
MLKLLKDNKFKIIQWILIGFLLYWGYNTFIKEKQNNVGTAVSATPAKEVKNVERIIERPQIIYVYPKETKQKVPEDIKKNDEEKMVASTLVKSDDHDHTVSTVLNIKTGEFKTFDYKEPLPFFRMREDGEIAVSYGFKNGLGQVGRLSIDQNIVQIKKIKIGASADVDTDSDWFAGVTVKYSW